MSFVAELEPRPLWKHFDEILQIPRPSKGEERARQYVLDLAKRKGYAHRVDATGNLVVEKPASPGKEGAPIVVLQGHLDMVTEKNSGVDHDFERDPIKPRQENGWVKATGTTLGADNGIGVAAILAVMEADDIVHGPLELLFTVNEETGLTGVLALDPEAIALKGRLLLNLDSEEEGAVTIGCAGGSATRLLLPLDEAWTPEDTITLGIQVSGLKGGHSGTEIHLQRGNANKLLARILAAALAETPLRLASLQGGNKHNAIPRESAARVVIPTEARDTLTRLVEREAAAIREELRPTDPDVRVEIAEADAAKQAWTEETTRKVVSLLNALPHGVLAMSQDIPGLVETSTNLATVGTDENHLVIMMSTRSSVASAMRAARARHRSFANLASASVEENEGYPGWKPDLSSPLLATFQEIHKKVTGNEPALRAVHAGLECGVLGEKFPGMKMISFGPVIEGAHSPDEGIRVDSVGPFYRLLVETLEELAS